MITCSAASQPNNQGFPPIRSPKARDLLSFLNGEETNDSNFQETSFNEHQIQTVEEQLPEVKKIDDDNLTLITCDKTSLEESLENLNHELLEVQELMNEFHQFVHLQGETVDEISGNVDCAEDNVIQGNVQLKKANILKAALFPILGAVVGGAVAGPIGFVAGAKVGSVTGGLAMAGVTGSVVGYQGGKLLKKRQQEQIELSNLNESDR
uniref:Syntaxin-17-like n=1 Tax=Phallusia mammillata TaxID=59560 RepID=A0A6F9DUI7_9ASCI|nr:syntaxin-17-like [Phallusia mammillata]